MKASLFLASACAASLSTAYGQMYLIQGSPTPKSNGGYTTSLLQVGADGAVRTVSQLLPGGGTGGTEWIGVSYDHRKAILVPKAPDHSILVLDFDTASVTKRCEAPPAPAGMAAFPFEEWLADMPGKGVVYVERYGTTDMTRLVRGLLGPGDDVTRGMLMDGATPCGQSFFTVATNDVKYLVSEGQADFGSSTASRIAIGKDGTPIMGWFGGEQTYFDYRVPESVMRSVAQPNASVALNNSEVLGAFVSDQANGRWSLAVLRKSDNTWHLLPGVGTSGPFVRGFGSFVALTETQPRSAQNPESAGASEWRKTETTSGGPSIELRIKSLPYVLPGKLDLYDAATEKTYSIIAKQGDSEILLVDHNTVYYRVSDRLYSAVIGANGLAPARLIATSESIRDVHWAFIKH